MPKLKSISIENFRSIGDEQVTIRFDENKPVILIGENNSGKTNIIRAIELMFGEFHPKYKGLEDYDHFERNPENKIVIDADVAGFSNKLGRLGEFSCGGFGFKCQRKKETEFFAVQLEDGNVNQYVSNSLREELLCVVVNAEQNLNYQLSYSSKYTLLSKVTKSFHERLVSDDEKVNTLKKLFEEIKQTFLKVKEFKDFSGSMSTIAGHMITNMSHALNFDFSAYDPSNYFRTLRVQPTEGADVRSFEELGTGQQQILALCFAHAYAKSFLGQGLIFVLDEPEAHLHPLAQKWLARQMFKMAEDGLQLVITTHSPYFINLEYLNSIYLVSKNGQTIVANTNAESLAAYCIKTGADKVDAKSILQFYALHSKPHILNGLFAKKIILVEGETEELSLPIYLEAIGLDTLKEGIGIVSVGGKGNLAKWWRLFTILKIPTFVCFDNDSNDDSKGLKRKDALKAIGISEGTIDKLLTSEDWNISEKFCVFGSNFEKTMRKSFSKYKEIEDEQIKALGSSKPIVARAVSIKLSIEDEFFSDPGWDNFIKVKDQIMVLK